MNVGTKSVLFGVHNFLWHPLTVGMSWFALYGKAPRWHEWVAIFCHDVGYWGAPNMDGPEGRQHPVRGAELAYEIVYAMCRDEDVAHGAYRLALGHSRFFAKDRGIPVSALFRADKACIYFDPAWFYILRATLSGEIHEYLRNAKLPPGTTSSQWFDHYLRVVGKLL